MKPICILTISGSLRARSTSTTVLQAVAALAPPHVRVMRFEGLDTLPHFNPDLDQDGATPPAVERFREEFRQADAVLISSPEYAHGVPGTLKNALDWLVSTPSTHCKPVGLLNPSPRSVHAHASLAETLRTMAMTVVPEASIVLPVSGRELDAAAIVRDARLAAALVAAVRSLVAAAGRARNAGPLPAPA